MNQMHHQPILQHPLSPSTPTFNLVSPNGRTIDYPPKSPDLPNSATNHQPLVSSTHQLNPLPPLHLQQQQHQQRKITQKASVDKLSNYHNNHHPSSNTNDPLLLSTFSEECKKMFYTGDPMATKKVESIIKNLPAGSKATYTKQMATIRSQFHRDAESSRRAEVDKLLLDTQPSSVIIKAVGNDSSLAALRSPRARQERLDRLKKFINAHCVRNMVGVHPFFNSLCAVLHLMSLPARKMGSGKRRVEWDIDLALFCEAGGEPFLVDSIQILKGVLGFEDHLKPLVASPLRGSFATTAGYEEDEDEDGAIDMVIGHPDGDDGLTLEERQEMEVDDSELTRLGSGEGPFGDSSSVLVEEGYGQASGLKGKARLKARDRALSDPFLDPAPTPAGAQSSPKITVSPPATEEQTVVYFAEPARPAPHALDGPPPSEIRLFRSPSYLTTPELRELIAGFPNFITARTKALKFDRDGALDSSAVSEKSRFRRNHHSNNRQLSTPFPGHGLIRISVFEKDQGWKGSLLERIKMFFFRFFNR